MWVKNRLSNFWNFSVSKFGCSQKRAPLAVTLKQRWRLNYPRAWVRVLLSDVPMSLPLLSNSGGVRLVVVPEIGPFWLFRAPGSSSSRPPFMLAITARDKVFVVNEICPKPVFGHFSFFFCSLRIFWFSRLALCSKNLFPVFPSLLLVAYTQTIPRLLVSLRSNPEPKNFQKQIGKGAIFRWRGGGKKGEKKEKKEKKKEKKKGEKRKKEREKKEEKRKRRERKNRRKTLESNSKSLVKTLKVSIRRRNGAPKDKFQLTNTHWSRTFFLDAAL